MSDLSHELLRQMGDLAKDVYRPPPSVIGARLRIGVVDAVNAAAGSDRASVTIDGLPVPYDAGYSPSVNDVVWWIEDQQVRVVGGKLA